MADQSHCPGETAIFTTTPTGAGPFSFVWRRNGEALDETNNTLTIANLPVGMPPTQITVEVNGGCSSVTNSAMLVVEDYIAVTNSITFTNVTPIQIVDNQPGVPYPSAIHVGCLWPDRVTKVQVGLYGITHPYSPDVCILLQGPSGVATPLIVNSGSPDSGMADVNLLFDDDGPPLPSDTPITSGTYQPTVYGTNVLFPAPAPATTNVGLAAFNGQNSHGDWNLYIYDLRILDGGMINGGWTLTLYTSEPQPPRFISSSFVPPAVDDLGMFSVTLVGEPNRMHVIEASTDLQNWTPIATNDLPTGTFLFSNPPPSTLLFYRAVRLP
jgi:subtilisin-like proprotein convertase family protein